MTKEKRQTLVVGLLVFTVFFLRVCAYIVPSKLQL